MSTNATKSNNTSNNTTVTPENALKKHDDLAKKFLAGLIVGAVLAIAVAMFMTASSPSAQAEDIATAVKEEVVAQTTTAPTTAIENVTPDEASSGGTCVATLPADSDLWDRVKNVFERIGCDVVVSVDEATGDAEAVKPTAPATDVPATTEAPATPTAQ